MKWTANPGRKPRYDGPLMVRWGSNLFSIKDPVSGPYDKKQWSKFDWTSAPPVFIEAVKKVEE